MAAHLGANVVNALLTPDVAVVLVLLAAHLDANAGNALLTPDVAVVLVLLATHLDANIGSEKSIDSIAVVLILFAAVSRCPAFRVDFNCDLRYCLPSWNLPDHTCETLELEAFFPPFATRLP